MQGRGRPAKLTLELEDYIDSLKGKNDGLTVRDIQGYLREFLFTTEKKAQPSLDDREIMRLVDNKLLPGESAITKHLSKPKEGKPSILDTPWSIGCCIEHDIPADFIPILIECRELFSSEAYLTIRKARWMVRLYPLVSRKLEKEFPENRHAQLSNLLEVASEYAIREQAANDRDRAFSYTNKLDSFLFLDVVRAALTGHELSLRDKIDVLTGEWEGELQ